MCMKVVPVQKHNFKAISRVVFYETRSMSTATFTPLDCEVRSVICFLTIEKVPSAKIYCPLCTAYGESVHDEQ